MVDRISAQPRFASPSGAEQSGLLKSTPEAAINLGLPSLFHDGVDVAARPGLKGAAVPAVTHSQAATRPVHQVVGQILSSLSPIASGLIQSAKRAWMQGLRVLFARRRHKVLMRSVRRRRSTKEAADDLGEHADSTRR